jgi:hypothetical protein
MSMGQIKSFTEFSNESYIGKGAASEKKQRRLKVAQEMEKRYRDATSPEERKKNSPSAIRRATGWFRNPYDKEWRFENNDITFELVNLCYKDTDKYQVRNYNIMIELVDLVKGSSLFREYPFLRKVSVLLSPSNILGSGNYNHEDELITLNGIPNKLMEKSQHTHRINFIENSILSDVDDFKATLPEITRHGKPFDKEAHVAEFRREVEELRGKLEAIEEQPLLLKTPVLKSTLIHEIQHAIQHVEGFALGGNPTLFHPNGNPDMYEERESRIKKQTEKLHSDFLRKYPDYKAAFDTLNDTPDENARMDAERVITRLLDQYGYWDKYYDAKDQVSPLYCYYLLAGEIESRDAQRRIGYPKHGGYAVYDVRRYSQYDWRDGLVRLFSTAEEATGFLKKGYRTKLSEHSGQEVHYFEDAQGQHIKPEHCQVYFVPSRTSEEPLTDYRLPDNTRYAPEDVIVRRKERRK